ncbi:exodeoxyribonuclease V subunit gamma [Leptospira wolffii]|uniref:exodeoxyribonuclease V subunit gamma n=1 Tax=Leptospira wolffii TaxID=409998 RepID=UPI0002D9EEC6|nr:exodeoxyribonuclease V subunit gamma [Leptospira wolffii]EPG65853.1 exodeoxyribonuclease V, gamma subunit [Leptospira wolffii serovar Khorat str. Khorat-H2]
MSITVFGSDDLSDLSGSLHESIREEIRRERGLHSPLIVIPNKSMETWLYLDLVRRSGVVFNLRFLFLEKILEELLLGKFSPNIDSRSRPFLQNDSRKFQIYSVLLRSPDLIRKYPILKSYLLPKGRETPDPDRLLDLSGRMAKYFKDYELHRQDWIRNWTGEKYSLLRVPGEDIWEEIATQSEIFFFQKELYSYISESSQKENLISYSMKIGTDEEKAPTGPPIDLHLFALSQLSGTYIAIFRNLLPEVNLKVYQFGIPQDSEVPGRERSEICRNWANPFRSLRKTWEKAGAEFVDLKNSGASKQSVKESVLGKFQKYLIYGSLNKDRLPPDRSLTILEAPGKQREVEAVFQNILAKLSDSPETKLTDFGIFCADLASYRPAIETVFDGGIIAKLSQKESKVGTRTLAYTIRDVLAGEASKYTSAVLSLFPLLSGQRSRADLFQLFKSPCFQSKWGIDSITVEEWSLLAENLELYQDDFTEESEPVSFSFRKGFVRLAAGYILPEEEEFSLPVSPYDSGSESSELWISIWARISRSLNGFQKRLSDPKMDGSSILESFLSLVSEILTSKIPESEEEEIELNLRDSFEELKDFDWDPKDPKDRIRFLEAFVKQSSQEIQVRKGKYLTGGITVSALQPMRPIPFRHIYILGLGEGLFPGSDDKSAFNLRHISPREGDIGLRSLNESLLYETILSAKESLVLSFVSENITNDESIAPSSSLLLIEQALKENVLLPESHLRSKVPLNKHSKEYFSSSETEARNDFLKNYDLSSSLIHGSDSDRILYSKKILGADSSPAISAIQNVGETKEIDWNELVKFCKSPLAYHMQRRFGLYVEEISETDTKSEEPFRISNELGFLSDIWNDSLRPRENFEPRNLYDSLKDVFFLWEKKGMTPRGIYRDVEFLSKARKIRDLASSLEETLSGSKVYTGLSFGASQKKEPLLALPSVPWKKKEFSLDLQGLKENILLKKEANGEDSILFIYPNSSKKLKNLIEPYLAQCLLDRLSGNSHPRSVIAILGYGDSPVVLPMNRKGQENIRKKFLDDLITEFLEPKSSLISPKLWEDFPDRSNSSAQEDQDSFRELSEEYLIWAKESVQYDPEIYLDRVLRLLSYPQDYVTEGDFALCLKLYEPIMKAIYAKE